MNISSVFFDWSGTISDDITIAVTTTNMVLGHYGLPPLTLDEFRESFTFPMSRLLAQKGIAVTDEEHLYPLVQKFLGALGARPSPLPGAIETLQWLRGKGLFLAVVSAHPHQFLVGEAARYGVADCFSAIHGSASTTRVAIIKDILASRNIAPDCALYVGDTAYDVQYARECGMRCAVVTTGYHRKEQLLAAQPDFVLERLEEIKAIIQ